MEACNEFIETEEFDKEYTLKDLLPTSILADLFGDIPRAISATVHAAGGDLYFGNPQDGWDCQELIRSQEGDLGEPITISAGPISGGLFGLKHELETIGFLGITTLSKRIGEAELALIGGITARAVNRIINLNCQHRMTTSLHGQVVTESYKTLKKKADQLARSEEKYRLLAENLEVEVARKTQEIRDTQVYLLQQEKMASIGQLAAGMAHEINNPVGFVISNLHTLKDNTDDLCALITQYESLADMMAAERVDSEDAGKIKETLSDIDRMRTDIDIEFVVGDMSNLINESLDGAGRVKDIVQSLRDFTHPSVENAESADINQCLDTTLTVLSSQLGANIKIQREYNTLPALKCHVRDINQAFFNILKNAIQSVDAAGEITIRTHQVDNSIVVSIWDNGVGIADDIRGRLFDPFFTTRDVGEGAGLGLTQAYNTVRSHGGEITVQSTPGEGSTVSVKLPIAAGK
jgi:two-component system, NtrC family, sensor kinase